MLKDIAKLAYGNQFFVIDKFSGFEKATFEVERINDDTRKITYFMNVYFSGQILKIKRTALFLVYKERTLFSSNHTPEYKFYQNAVQNGLHLTFEKSGYKSGEPTDIIPDFVRWFAENTNTTNVLEEFKKDVKFCLEFIDKYYPFKRKNEDENCNCEK